MSPYVIAIVLIVTVPLLLLGLATILIDASGGDAPDLVSDLEEDVAPLRLT